MFRPPTISRIRAVSYRPQRLFSTTPPSLSALFNLHGLAHSRESQYLSRERGIPRTEYSSNIHLIRSSEVDPFPSAPGASKHANESRGLSRKQTGRAATIAAVNMTEERLVQYLMDGSHPAQQRKSIEDLLVQLRVAREEIAQLQATMRGDGLGREDGQRAPWHWKEYSLFTLTGAFALFVWFEADLEKVLSKYRVGKWEAAEATTVESSDTDTAEVANSAAEPMMTTGNEPQDLLRSQHHRRPLSFLWA